MSEKLETSKASGAHHLLSKLAGEWEGTAKVWFEPGNPVDESPVRGTMRVLMNGRYLLHEYNGSFQGKPLEGLAIYGHELGLKKFQAAWIDSFHTGSAIMFSESARGGNEFSVLGSYAYVTQDTEQHWGWRTTIELVNDDEVIITAYNISPEGEEAKATETAYKRVKPV